ncbi:nSTAND1 domain-containing NTPase [Gymnodinialimonas sp.]
MQVHRDLSIAQSVLARLRDSAGLVVGAGFLIGDLHVMTCAHVIDDCLRRRKGTKERPDEAILLDLPYLGIFGVYSRVVAWVPMLQPGSGEPGELSDIAVLELDSAAFGGLDSANSQLSDPGEGTPFRTFGFPIGNDNATIADGELSIVDSGGWRQILDTDKIGYFVQQGFSGAPVFSERNDRLLGMVAAADPDPMRRLAHVIPTSLLARAWPLLAKPYKELAAFAEEDRDLFFGRDEFIDELEKKVNRLPFLTVIGPSGSGKSSVVMAGLLPRLAEAGGWSTIVFQPRRRPLYQLSHALAKLALGRDGSRSDIQSRADAHELRLLDDPAGALELIETALSEITHAERLCIVIDQFEELFTFDDRRQPLESENDDAQRIDEFLAVLSAIGRQNSRKVTVHAVATLRADFTGIALRHRALAELMTDADAKLGPMTPTALAMAIENPAAQFDVSFEPGLTAEIVADMAGNTGGLPLMQFALDRLWKRQEERKLTHAQYRAIGGVAGALAEHAETFHGDCTEKERIGLRRVFLRLVLLAAPGDETEDTRSVALRSDFSAEDWPLVQSLAEARLVMIGHDAATSQESVEVVHEALIRSWPRLMSWLNEDRAFGLWRQRLRAYVENHRSRGSVLTEDLLIEAEHWKELHGSAFSATENALIEASVSARQEAEMHRVREREERLRILEQSDQRQKLALRRLVGLAVLLLLSLVGVGVFWQRAALSEAAAVEARLVAEENVLTTEAALIQAESAREAESAALEREQAQLRIAEQALARAEEERTRAEEALLLAEQATREAEDAFNLAAAAARDARLAQENAELQRDLAREAQRLAQTAADREAEQRILAEGAAAREQEARERVLAFLMAADARLMLTETSGSTAARRAAALSIEAWHRFPSSLALNTAFQSTRELPVFEIDVGEPIVAMAYNPVFEEIVILSTSSFLVYDATSQAELVRTNLETSQIPSGSYLHDTIFIISPDGNRIFFGGPAFDSSFLLDARSGRVISIHPNQQSAAADFSPNSEHLAFSIPNEATIAIVNTVSGALVDRTRTTYSASSIDYSPDGQQIAIGNRDEIYAVAIFNSNNLQAEPRIFEDGGYIVNLQYFPDGERIAATSVWGGAYVFDTATGAQAFTPGVGLNTPAAFYPEIAIGPEGFPLAIGAPNGEMRIFSGGNNVWYDSGRVDLGVEHSEGLVHAIFDPSGRYLITGSTAGAIRVSDATSGTEIFRAEHGGSISSISLDPEGQWLFSASTDGLLRAFWLWSSAAVEFSNYQVETLGEFGGQVNGRFASENNIIFSDLFGLLQHIQAPQPSPQFAEFNEILGFSADGSLIVVETNRQPNQVEDGSPSFEVHDLRTGELLQIDLSSLEDERVLNCIGFSAPGNQIIAIGSSNAFFQSDRELERVRFPEEGRTISRSFNCRHQIWAIGGEYSYWDLLDGPSSTSLLSPRTDPHLMTISPNGETYAYTQRDARWLEVVSTRSNEILARIEHSAPISRIYYDYSGEMVVFQGADETIRMSEVSTGAEFLRIGPENGEVVGISPSGDWLYVRDGPAASQHPHTVRLVPVGANLIFDTLCTRRAGRNLSASDWVRYFGDTEAWRPSCSRWSP